MSLFNLRSCSTSINEEKRLQLVGRFLHFLCFSLFQCRRQTIKVRHTKFNANSHLMNNILSQDIFFMIERYLHKTTQLLYNMQMMTMIPDFSGQHPQGETMDNTNYSRNWLMQWHIWSERSPHKREVGWSNPSRGRPKSLKQVVTALLARY